MLLCHYDLCFPVGTETVITVGRGHLVFVTCGSPLLPWGQGCGLIRTLSGLQCWMTEGMAGESSLFLWLLTGPSPQVLKDLSPSCQTTALLLEALPQFLGLSWKSRVHYPLEKGRALYL